jgi:hypothetical protein
LVRVVWVESLVRVEFGPSVRFDLGEDSAPYAGLARLLERVRHWRATEVFEGDEPVSVFHAKDIRVLDCPISHSA